MNGMNHVVFSASLLGELDDLKSGIGRDKPLHLKVKFCAQFMTTNRAVCGLKMCPKQIGIYPVWYSAAI